MKDLDQSKAGFGVLLVEASERYPQAKESRFGGFKMVLWHFLPEHWVSCYACGQSLVLHDQFWLSSAHGLGPSAVQPFLEGKQN